MADQPGTVADYQNYAAKTGEEFGIPQGLLPWIIQKESNYNPTAKNPNSSAYGIAQFTDATAKQFNLDRSDPYASINDAGVYLVQLKQKTGSWIGAVNAYGTTSMKDSSGKIVTNPTLEQQAVNIINSSVPDAINQNGTNGYTSILGEDKQGGTVTGFYPNVNSMNGQGGNPSNSQGNGNATSGDTAGKGNGGSGGVLGSLSLNAALLFILGIALFVLAILTTDKGKQAISVALTKVK